MFNKRTKASYRRAGLKGWKTRRYNDRHKKGHRIGKLRMLREPQRIKGFGSLSFGGRF